MKTAMITLASLMSLSMCAPAMAQEENTNCFSTEQAWSDLSTENGGRAVSGIAYDGSLMEIWVNENNQWVLLRTTIDGVSCVIIKGESLALIPTLPNV